MINLVLFGPPGSGKGTQGKGIAERYGLTAVSTGDILRSEMAKGTPLGIEAKKHIEKGNLVPDQVIINMMEELIHNHANDGLLFDGFPRTVEQAKAFDAMLKKMGQAVTALIELSVPDEQLVVRLLKRREIEGRSDDNIETITNRLEVYHTQTEPIVDYYHSQGKHIKIDGVGTIDEIEQRLQQALDAKLK